MNAIMNSIAVDEYQHIFVMRVNTPLSWRTRAPGRGQIVAGFSGAWQSWRTTTHRRQERNYRRHDRYFHCYYITTGTINVFLKLSSK